MYTTWFLFARFLYSYFSKLSIFLFLRAYTYFLCDQVGKVNFLRRLEYCLEKLTAWSYRDGSMDKARQSRLYEHVLSFSFILFV